ncbi:MFS transporter [Roseisolibacter agri]|uniref:MFS transporter n=1 Tax=Roseisolibacter agri TaxID=2014610 RepID=A0AA37QAZ5_9BACT|nr:MFS transporter [Roseisolibacter agri]GLC25581.1 MFS transporter [Roseisolibacter agri]
MHDPYAALRVAAFRRYIAGLLTLILATQIQGVVVSWQVYAVTHDALSLGLIGLAEALPFIGFALWAGHVADRVDRRKLTIGATVVLTLCSAALLALSLAPPAARTHVALIYAIIFVSGIARSFLNPARTALSTELVPRALLANSLTWRSTTWQTAAVGGPALGGVLYALAGAPLAYALDTALMLIALVAFVRVRHTPAPRPPATVSVGRSLLEGIAFVRRQPVLLGAMSLDLFSVLFGGAVALLPIFANEILRVGPQGLGMLRAAPAAGAVLVSLWLAHRPPVSRTGPVLLGVVAAFGLTMIGFGLSRSFALSVALLVASGGVDMVSVNIRSMLLQLLVPEHLLGRVSSVNQIFIGSSNEIGAFESGVAARLLGAAPSVVLGGALTLAVVGVTAWAVPALRKMGAIPHADDRAAA